MKKERESEPEALPADWGLVYPAPYGFNLGENYQSEKKTSVGALAGFNEAIG